MRSSRADRGHLSAYLRQSYENGGSQAMIAYIISANTIAAAIQRDVQVNEISSASQQLVARIAGRGAEGNQHACAGRRGARAGRCRGGAGPNRAGDHQGADADAAAGGHHGACTGIPGAEVTCRRCRSARRCACARRRSIRPVPGPLFTVDTNLTVPSGETAASLNQFLNGSALAGLGASFMQAETTYHVSARYFVAHAILESALGHERDRAEQAQPLRLRRGRREPLR